jgi:hypothetical protein
MWRTFLSVFPSKEKSVKLAAALGLTIYVFSMFLQDFSTTTQPLTTPTPSRPRAHRDTSENLLLGLGRCL